MIKEPEGALYIFDPDLGTLDLSEETAAEAWFSKFQRFHRIHLTETLSLLRAQESPDASLPTLEKKMVIDDEVLKRPEISYQEREGRWEKVEFYWRGKTTCFVRDTKTSYIYSSDSKKLIRIKCLLLGVKTPLDALCRTLYHVAMTVFRLIALPFCAVLKGKKRTFKLLKNSARSLADIFRAPLYGVAGTGVALYGVIKPYEGRRLYGYLERGLNRQHHHTSLRKKYYSAPCFRPINFNAADPGNSESNQNEMKKMTLI